MKAPRTAATALMVGGGLLATGSLALAAGPRAHAAATPQGGKIQILVTPVGTSQTKAKVTVIGAVGDYGTGLSETKQGKVNANGAYEELKLGQGTMLVDAVKFNKALDHVRPQINRASCSFAFAGSGPATIISGTGAYAGAHGQLTLTAEFAGIAIRKANGKCNFSQNAPVHGQFSLVTGKGTVSF